MNLIAAAVLFGPAAVAGPAAAVAWWRHRGEYDAALAEVARVQAQTTAAEPPPDGGMPEPGGQPDGEQLAEVIPLPQRRAA